MKLPSAALFSVAMLLAACGADGNDSQAVNSAPEVTFSTTPAPSAPDTTVAATTGTTQTESTAGGESA